uniref:Uncharacterized protein n=1 Tax=Romanomermis culicivorax TaxID=13658 RepID=A0A915JVL2_ROMCU
MIPHSFLELLIDARNRLKDCCDLNKYANLLIIRLRPFNVALANAHQKCVQYLDVAQIWLPPKLKK